MEKGFINVFEKRVFSAVEMFKNENDQEKKNNFGSCKTRAQNFKNVGHGRMHINQGKRAASVIAEISKNMRLCLAETIHSLIKPQ